MSISINIKATCRLYELEFFNFMNFAPSENDENKITVKIKRETVIESFKFKDKNCLA